MYGPMIICRGEAEEWLAISVTDETWQLWIGYVAIQ